MKEKALLFLYFFHNTSANMRITVSPSFTETLNDVYNGTTAV